jgi:3-oxoacyl-[acyl-carrier protein] reductase
MNKLALITGGSRGLGLYLVKKFWTKGYSIIVVARNAIDKNDFIKKLPTRKKQNFISFSCDLSEINQVKSLIDRIKSTTSHIDVLINNAAIQGPIGQICDNDMLEWNKTLRVNLIAPVTLCHGLIPLMKKKSGSSIINISGGGATGPRVNFSAYATAKAGLVRFSETISEELKLKGIRVNCIAPGAMKTDMLREVLIKRDVAGVSEIKKAENILSNDDLTITRVANLAFFLASDISKGITGKLISAIWDNWEQLPNYLDELSRSDVYTLRRITSQDRGYQWSDNE